MIALEVEFLTGRFVASSFHDRDLPEWPPHPARLFSALVATVAEHPEIGQAGRRALEWLEEQGPPQVLASGAGARALVTVYVPGNSTRVLGDWSRQEQALEAARVEAVEAERSGDERAIRRARTAVETAAARLEQQLARVVADDGRHARSAWEEAVKMLPDGRGKQPKKLPSVTPELPRVRYEWPEADPDAAVRGGLAEVARRVVRLGHSSTLVACRLVEAPGDQDLGATADRWIPVEEGRVRMRTVAAGQLAALDAAHARHRGVEPRVLPAVHQPYRRQGEAGRAEPVGSVFGEWFVLREVAEDGRARLGLRLTRTEDVTRALRGALLHHAGEPAPALLTGHGRDGGPLEEPHAAFLALADVASRYAGGAILGVAVVLPRTVAPADRRAVLRALGRWEQAGSRLVMGRAGAMQLERVVDEEGRSTLRSESWCAPVRRWASVTPVALDENPGDLASRDPVEAREAAERAGEIVARACERIGLPRPEWVQVMRRSLWDAVPAAVRFMPFPRKEGAVRRVCVHVEVRFGVEVAGPVVLGAGRYFGLGLCRGRREA